MISPQDKAFLTALFDAAVVAADPRQALARHMPQPPKGRTVVIGAGKGAAQLAAAFEDLWDAPLEGVVVTRYGYAAPCRKIKVLEAAHPVPDAAGLAATAALKQAVSGLGPDDLVVSLVCGGGSALLPDPQDGLSLEDEADLNRTLLASGAPISAMNAIRKQFSNIKGGRLAALAHPARVVSLVVSDVPGDDPAQVASGRRCPMRQRRRMPGIWCGRIALPCHRVLRRIWAQATPAPQPDAVEFSANTVSVVASAALSLDAAARVAEAGGIPAVVLSDAIEGEAREVGGVLAAIATQCATRDQPFTKPVVLLSGGETTVTLGDAPGGRGGRNTECLLAAALSVQGVSGITMLMADTDGIDGSETNAGAFADGTTAARLRAAGKDPVALLTGHDAWAAFSAVEDLFEPGPTGTNVNDFRAILVR